MKPCDGAWLFIDEEIIVSELFLWHTPISSLWKCSANLFFVAEGETMHRMTLLWLRIKAFVLRGKSDRDLDDELAFNLAMKEEKEGSAAGQGDDTRYAVRRGFGNVAQIKEACREMRTFMSLEAFWQDLR